MQKDHIKKDRANVEVDTMKEGFRSVLKTKFYNEWRRAKREQAELTGMGAHMMSLFDDQKCEQELEELIV